MNVMVTTNAAQLTITFRCAEQTWRQCNVLQEWNTERKMPNYAALAGLFKSEYIKHDAQRGTMTRVHCYFAEHRCTHNKVPGCQCVFQVLRGRCSVVKLKISVCTLWQRTSTHGRVCSVVIKHVTVAGWAVSMEVKTVYWLVCTGAHTWIHRNSNYRHATVFFSLPCMQSNTTCLIKTSMPTFSTVKYLWEPLQWTTRVLGWVIEWRPANPMTIISRRYQVTNFNSSEWNCL